MHPHTYPFPWGYLATAAIQVSGTGQEKLPPLGAQISHLLLPPLTAEACC